LTIFTLRIFLHSVMWPSQLTNRHQHLILNWRNSGHYYHKNYG